MFGIDVMILYLFHFSDDTPLIIAARKKHGDICGMLVQNGADVNAKSKE